MEEETPEGLDDIRRKRLAYFETKSSTNNEANCNAKSEMEEADNKGIASTKLDPKGLQSETGASGSRHVQDIPIEHQGIDKAYANRTVTEKYGNSSIDLSNQTGDHINPTESTSMGAVKTSSFYFPSPDKTTENTTDMRKIGQDDRNFPGMESIPKTTEKVEQDDGYNETVERLIRATKEELLGMKSTDDIWKNIKTNLPGSNSIQPNIEQRTPGHSEQIDNRTNNLQHRNSIGSMQQQQTNTERTSQEYLSASLTNFHEAQNIVKPKLFSQTSVPAGVKFQSYELHPAPSRMEPFYQKPHNTQQVSQKSLNNNTVEELFSSRQMLRSIAMPQNHGNAAVSQDFDASVPMLTNNQQSVDFSDLGLSTHRPETDVKDEASKVEADDINLGDTVTQELRTLLGEEKFQQFLIKSKKDIDGLHQDRMSDISDGSARKDKTPRLLKERPTLPKKPNTPTSDRKLRTNKKHSVATTDNGVNSVANEITKPQESRENKDKSSRKSQDFTPRESDADVVNNLIGKYVLTQTETNKKITTNPALKTKKTHQDSKEEQASSSTKPVPDLNLEALQNDSPRPKLNRPKHEPATIYSDKLKPEISDKDSLPNSSDGKQSPGRNYEQVTVPRNVAFSANEIYHQAYGMYFANQVGNMPMSPVIMGNGLKKAQLHGPPVSATLTPKTPTGSVPFADPSDFNNQLYLGHKPQEQSAYPPVSGMTYHGMPMTSVAPYESPPQMYNSGEDTTHLGQFLANNAQPPGANENFQLSSSQSSQPYMYAPYNQMYGMMPEFRGYPAGMAPSHPVRMPPPPPPHPAGFTHPTGMTPPSGMMSPRFPMPVMDQSMHIPHPPASVSASQQLNQSASSVVYSSAPGVPMAYQYPYPVMVVTPHPPGEPPATPSTVQPQTPQTSHAEVQTEERETAEDKGMKLVTHITHSHRLLIDNDIIF